MKCYLCRSCSRPTISSIITFRHFICKFIDKNRVRFRRTENGKAENYLVDLQALAKSVVDFRTAILAFLITIGTFDRVSPV